MDFNQLYYAFSIQEKINNLFEDIKNKTNFDLKVIILEMEEIVNTSKLSQENKNKIIKKINNKIREK